MMLLIIPNTWVVDQRLRKPPSLPPSLPRAGTDQKASNIFLEVICFLSRPSASCPMHMIYAPSLHVSNIPRQS